jgi:hypothetical protein
MRVLKMLKVIIRNLQKIFGVALKVKYAKDMVFQGTSSNHLLMNGCGRGEKLKLRPENVLKMHFFN